MVVMSLQGGGWPLGIHNSSKAVLVFFNHLEHCRETCQDILCTCSQVFFIRNTELDDFLYQRSLHHNGATPLRVTTRKITSGLECGQVSVYLIFCFSEDSTKQETRPCKTTRVIKTQIHKQVRKIC